MNSITLAAEIITRVIDQGKSLNDALVQVFAKHPNHPESAFIKAQAYGTVRWYFRLSGFARQLLNKPSAKTDPLILSLILVGLHQLKFSDRADYACVSETVNALDGLKKPWARRLVNAVLRNFIRQRQTLTLNLNFSEKMNHPQWLIEQLKKAWPNDWQMILKTNDQHPRFALRVNQSQIATEQYLEKLKQKNMPAEMIKETGTGILVTEPLSVEKLPGFFKGRVSVQDIGAQLAAPLLDLKPGMRVLDACSAPGGKACHILESHPDSALIALDKDPKRLAKVSENLQRLNLKGQIKVADCAQIDTWWDGKPFDRILLDAPCSGTGVIRRHPDIKLLRKPTDIKKLQQQQLTLLSHLWTTLKPGGQLLYATCSVLPSENQQVISQFLQHHFDASEVAITHPFGANMHPGLQLLPEVRHDGFYYCILLKRLT